MEQDLLDLRDDLHELLYIAKTTNARLSSYKTQLKNSVENYYPKTFIYISKRCDDLIAQYENKISSINSTLNRGLDSTATGIQLLLTFKLECTDYLRTMQAEAASLLVADNWQAPTYQHSMIPQAGNETDRVGFVSGYYKRDSHKAEKRFARQFVKEYVRSGYHLKPRAYITSSGMSAFMTAINHLQMTGKKVSNVMYGHNTYFQNKWIIEHSFPNNCISFNEFETEEIVALVKQHQPEILIISSCCNSAELPIPNLKLLIPQLASNMSRGSTILIDNTCMATEYHPLLDLPVLSPLNIIVIESLLKYHQFGFDRVNAGVIWVYGDLFNSFDITVKNTGTRISDISLSNLILPNAKLLKKRLQRISRNTQILAERLDTYIKSFDGPALRIVHPALGAYTGYNWTKDLAFKGGSFVIEFKPFFRNVFYYQILIKRLISTARSRNININDGTSFGYNTTRIFMTISPANGAPFFIRVSPGTETLSEIEEIIAVFEKSLQLF